MGGYAMLCYAASASVVGVPISLLSLPLLVLVRRKDGWMEYVEMRWCWCWPWELVPRNIGRGNVIVVARRVAYRGIPCGGELLSCVSVCVVLFLLSRPWLVSSAL